MRKYLYYVRDTIDFVLNFSLGPRAIFVGPAFAMTLTLRLSADLFLCSLLLFLALFGDAGGGGEVGFDDGQFANKFLFLLAFL